MALIALALTSALLKPKGLGNGVKKGAGTTDAVVRETLLPVEEGEEEEEEEEEDEDEEEEEEEDA
jgi:hypothetical protein